MGFLFSLFIQIKLNFILHIRGGLLCRGCAGYEIIELCGDDIPNRGVQSISVNHINADILRNERADYGKKIVSRVATQLTEKYGRTYGE